MMKKIICAGMAVAMMAALAIPASAANTTTTSVSNQTQIVFDFKSNINPWETDAFTFTIPATVNLTEGTELATGGTGFSGKVEVSVDGRIGNNDKVVLSVASANSYQLTDGTNYVADYKMSRDGTAETGVTYGTAEFSGANAVEVASFNAEAFNKESGIDLKIENTDSNKIYGQGKYYDVLTFTCDYFESGATKGTSCTYCNDTTHNNVSNGTSYKDAT